MGSQRDQIEDLADELDIDYGDSSSQLDRMKKIAEAVGMEDYNGLSNSDTDELERRLKENKRQRTNLGGSPNNGYAQRRNSQINPRTQVKEPNGKERKNGTINKAKKKVTSAVLKHYGVPKEIAENEQLLELAEKGNFMMKIPMPVKLVMIALIIGIPFIALMVFIVIFNEEDTSGSSGSFAYGQTCTSVTVENTGCDMNAGNCSHVYDGDVELEEYIAGVVAAEVGSANNLEYYKVAAISARTFFLSHVSDSCTVDGNATFQSYKDVEESSNASLIKQAVEETAGLVLVKDDELANANYASACVVNADEDYYYVRYGTSSLGEANFQKIPKDWDNGAHAFSGYLAEWYSYVDKNDTDLENKKCPNNHDYGMSQIGALYLVSEENYSYDEVIEYYFGSDIEILENKMQLSGVEGFINPTSRIYCSSPFGYRTHPVRGKTEYHSGLDIAISGGEPVYAAKDGTIRVVDSNFTRINSCGIGTGYGNYIIIDHEDGMSTVYAHMKYGSIPSWIEAGATVSQGEQIGQIGSTGCSTGNHLHYEVRVNNERVDPADYLDLTNATGTCKR